MANEGDSFQKSSVSESDVDNSSQSTASVIAPNEQCEIQGLKTKELLMGWPIVSLTVEKVQKYYQSFKSSNRILNWGCDVSEKLASTLYERTAPVRTLLCPAVRNIDLVASDVAERVQKKLPAVRESPWKVYKAVKLRFCELFAPTLHKMEFVVGRGERRLRKVVRSATGVYRKFVVAVDKWLDEVEIYIENYRSKGAEAPQISESTDVTRSVDTKSWTPVGAALGCATTAAMFSLGAAAWLLSRLPLVGRVVTLSPSSSAASSKSTSPKSDKSSSSYESIPDSTATGTRKMDRGDLNLEHQPQSEQ